MQKIVGGRSNFLIVSVFLFDSTTFSWLLGYEISLLCRFFLIIYSGHYRLWASHVTRRSSCVQHVMNLRTERKTLVFSLAISRRTPLSLFFFCWRRIVLFSSDSILLRIESNDPYLLFSSSLSSPILYLLTLLWAISSVDIR